LIAAIVLTAGKSERMMGRPKALLQFKDRTFLEHVLGAIEGAGIIHTAVVVGHHRSEIVSALNLPTVVFNPDYEQGMSTSVQAGIRVLPAGLRGVGIFLVDHPLIDATTVRLLAARLEPGRIVLPFHEGRRGHPVFFSEELFGEILALRTDQGLNVTVRRDPTRVIEVPVANAGVLRDIDTPEEFEKLLHEGR
jgi:CTP:molybdopterin cytidylyltransferase MocA